MRPYILAAIFSYIQNVVGANNDRPLYIGFCNRLKVLSIIDRLFAMLMAAPVVTTIFFGDENARQRAQSQSPVFVKYLAQGLAFQQLGAGLVFPFGFIPGGFK